MTNISKQLRLSLVAPSGSGKSTLARMLQEKFEAQGLSVAVLKLAQPLYEIQADFYEKSLVHVARDRQNQRLLEIIATEMRNIDPCALINNFQRRLDSTDVDVVINDDLRDDRVDWPYLKNARFKIVRVLANSAKRRMHLSGRGDLSVVANSHLNQQIASIRADFVLVNNASMDDLEFQAMALVKYLMPSCTTPVHGERHALA